MLLMIKNFAYTSDVRELSPFLITGKIHKKVIEELKNCTIFALPKMRNVL